MNEVINNLTSNKLEAAFTRAAQKITIVPYKHSNERLRNNLAFREYLYWTDKP